MLNYFLLLPLKARQRLDQMQVVGGAFDAFILDATQHLSHYVRQSEQPLCNVGSASQLTVAQAAEQAFASVRVGLQFLESEETTGSFDGVDGTEDIDNRGLRRRVLL